MACLGLISDTHNELRYIDRAIDLFAAEGCDNVIHAGDIESPDALRSFARLTNSGVRFHWILGEHDAEAAALRSVSDEIGANWVPLSQLRPSMVIGGLATAVIHNPYGGKGQRKPFLLERLCDRSSGLDLVVYGHFHYFNIKYPSTRSPVSVVCPGACRQDVEPRSVAILDTGSRQLRVFALETRATQAALAFSTTLIAGGQSSLTAGPGLTDHFRRGVRRNLEDSRRKYWRINDHWGQDWLGDWLDPNNIIALGRRAG
jgi:hypothetical protein